MTKLADKIEALEGPDRGVDWEIHCRNGLDGVGLYGKHLAYTQSLDAAMTLLPTIQPAGDPERHADFILECTNGGLTICAMVGHNDRDKCSWGATPALALCAAALRAREAKP